ncbi:MAG: hypothetical protein M1812_006599 [Candelaria pacifica]|nr:MAG: hypothetical protein M1812_006599 [Candelaria pacifica]
MSLFPTALRTCLSCLVNNTLTTPHSTSALSVYINFCAASPTAVDLAAFLEEEPILIQLQNSWGVISTFTDTHGAGLLTQMPTVYAGPTSTIGVSKSLIGGGGKNSSSVKSTVEASPEPTVSASATPTGKKASAGRVDVRGWLAGVVGLVVFGVGFLFVD